VTCAYCGGHDRSDTHGGLTLDPAWDGVAGFPFLPPGPRSTRDPACVPSCRSGRGVLVRVPDADIREALARHAAITRDTRRRRQRDVNGAEYRRSATDDGRWVVGERAVAILLGTEQSPVGRAFDFDAPDLRDGSEVKWSARPGDMYVRGPRDARRARRPFWFVTGPHDVEGCQYEVRGWIRGADLFADRFWWVPTRAQEERGLRPCYRVPTRYLHHPDHRP
jgi:hypothetical protein